MKLKQIISFLEEYAPLALQESYDNAGLILGNPDYDINQALICLDVTESVIEEAINRECNLIISHHPLIFNSIKKITGQDYTERMVIRAIKNDLAVYAIHTNIDKLVNGVNGQIAKRLGLTNVQILSPDKELLCKLVTFCPVDKADKVRQALYQAGAGHIGNYDSCSFNVEGRGSFRALNNTSPYVGKVRELHYENETRIETIYPAYKENEILDALFKSHPYEEVAYDIYHLGNEFKSVGSGIVGDLSGLLDESVFLDHLKKTIDCKCIRHSRLTGEKVNKIAICGGSGSFLIRKAIDAKVHIYVTSDLKYHDFFTADDKLLLVDIGHYESEQFTKELLHAIISEKFPNFACLISDQSTNAVNYYIK